MKVWRNCAIRDNLELARTKNKIKEKEIYTKRSSVQGLALLSLGQVLNLIHLLFFNE
jgi:hypothetical protein